MKKPLPQSVIYRKLSDDELAHRCARRSDKLAGAELFSRYGHVIWGLCYAAMGDTAAASADTERIFLRLTEEAGKFRIDAFRPWLYALVRRELGERAHLPAGVDFDADVASLSYTSEEIRFRSRLLPAYNSLPGDAQAILDGFYLHGNTHAELAAAMELTPEEAQKRITAGRKEFKEMLKTTKPGPNRAVEDVVHLLHLLEQGRCLSKKQLLSYTAGTMEPEESHAVEHHLHACPLCQVTVEAIQHGGAPAREAMAQHTDRFLAHARRRPVQESPGTAGTPRRRPTARPALRTIAIAAGVVLGAGLLWFMDNNRKKAVAASVPVIPEAAPRQVTPRDVTVAAPEAPIVKPAVVKSAAPAPAKKEPKQREKPVRAEDLPQVTEQGQTVPVQKTPEKAPPKEPRDPFEEPAGGTQ